MKVLLSIKPEFVEKIFSGEKRYEYRKAIFSKFTVTTVVIYATMPVGKIVGEFTVDSIIEDGPSELWDATKEYSGITNSFYWEYFSGRKKAYAIKIGGPVKYNEAIDPYELDKAFCPPQSFRYLYAEQ